MKKLVLIFVACLAAFAATAQSSIDLGKFVESYNADCPMKVDEGITIEKLNLADDAIEFHLTMNIPAAMIASLKQNADMLKSGILTAIASENDMKRLCHEAANSGRGLRIIIACNDKSDSLTIPYTATDLSAL